MARRYSGAADDTCRWRISLLAADRERIRWEAVWMFVFRDNDVLDKNAIKKELDRTDYRSILLNSVKVRRIALVIRRLRTRRCLPATLGYRREGLATCCQGASTGNHLLPTALYHLHRDQYAIPVIQAQFVAPSFVTFCLRFRCAQHMHTACQTAAVGKL